MRLEVDPTQPSGYRLVPEREPHHLTQMQQVGTAEIGQVHTEIGEHGEVLIFIFDGQAWQQLASGSSITGARGVAGPAGEGIHILSAVSTVGDLPSSGNTHGDAHLVTATGNLHVWATDNTWHEIGHIAGPPGPHGPDGPQGPLGPKGDDGGAGPQGIKGDDGAKGDQGPIGTAGVQGPTGAQGIKGDAGTAGTKGDTGSPGADGAIGGTGPRGLEGPKGDTGGAGPKGDTGTQGAPGHIGPDGAKGDTGAAGAAGAKGDTGEGIHILSAVPTVGDLPSSGNAHGDAHLVTATGNLHVWGTNNAWHEVGHIAGPTGPKGDTGGAGPKGTTGAQGVPGHIGPDGHKGDTGAAGAKGDTGAIGPIGHDGPAGAKGAPGTTGPQGHKGDTGGAGAQGVAGPKGDTGGTGPQGGTGAAGAGGAKGDPGDPGPKGDTGPTGAGLDIKSAVPTHGDLPVHGNHPGDAHLVTSSGVLYVWGTDHAWHELGHIQGPAGPTGPAGPVGTSPTGAMIGFGGAAAPAGWAMCNGAAVATHGTYAALFAVIGHSYRADPGGAKFYLPNMMGRSPMMANPHTAAGVIGDTKGVVAPTMLEHDHSAASLITRPHTHSIAHDHVAENTGNQSATHYHTANPPNTYVKLSATGAAGTRGNRVLAGRSGDAGYGGLHLPFAGGHGVEWAAASVDIAPFHTGNANAAHHHAVNPRPFAGNSGGQSANTISGRTGSRGDRGVNAIEGNLHPVLGMNWIIKL